MSTTTSLLSRYAAGHDEPVGMTQILYDRIIKLANHLRQDVAVSSGNEPLVNPYTNRFVGADLYSCVSDSRGRAKADPIVVALGNSFAISHISGLVLLDTCPSF